MGDDTKHSEREMEIYRENGSKSLHVILTMPQSKTFEFLWDSMRWILEEKQCRTITRSFP